MSTNPRTIFEATRRDIGTYSAPVPHLVGTPAMYIIADPILISTKQRGIITHTPPAAANSDLNQTYYAFYIPLTISITGTWLNVGIVADPIEVSLSVSDTTYVAGVLFTTDAVATVTLTVDADVDFALPKSNWIKWSNIGDFDFTIGRKNVAGEMPLGWQGQVYEILKLGIGAVVYGSGGISKLSPHDNVWSHKTIHAIGIKSAWSVTGNDQFHMFVDNNSKLWLISDQPNLTEHDKVGLLGYEEFLSAMTAHVLSYDPSTEMVYICDGTTGYVYSLRDKSLGEGPANITGIGYAKGVSYVAADNTITTPTFEITTDILDFGTRLNKTLREVEIGTNTTGKIYYQVSFRSYINDSFTETGYNPLNPEGMLTFPAFGKEFKISLRSSASFDLDYMRIKGVIHDYNVLDL